MPALSIEPGHTLNFPQVAWVPREWNALSASGMQAWFPPEAHMLFTASFGETEVAFPTPSSP